jgi:hypothetical protein
MTLPIALMPPSATPIATTSLMVNCLRLRLLMVSVSIKPGADNPIAGAGTLWLTALGAAVNPNTQADPNRTFCDGRHTAPPFTPLGTRD